MTRFLGYRCSICAKEYGPEEVTYTCPLDGGNLDVRLDYDAMRASLSPQDLGYGSPASMWRYQALLPIEEPGHQDTPLGSVGWTPMVNARAVSERMGLKRLWIKDDGRNPTASFKDRASALVVSRAEQIGAQTVVTASTGNAGAALAGMAAAAGMPSVILAPQTAPKAKIAQLLIFGARVILVEGTYDEAFDLSVQASEALGWYCRNTGYNPFTAEGKKTASFEISEQLTQRLGPEAERPDGWRVPDAVFVSVGDGNIISGLHKGFKDLWSLGWTSKVPKLFGIQSTGSAAVANAFNAGADAIEPVRSDTLADSISVDMPRDGLRALRAARETGGSYLTVADEAILEAMRELGVELAIFAEPAGATAYAGLTAAVNRGLLGSEDEIVVLSTGSGLKDVEAGMLAAGKATVIEPTLGALRQAIS